MTILEAAVRFREAVKRIAETDAATMAAYADVETKKTLNREAHAALDKAQNDLLNAAAKGDDNS